VCRYSVMDCQRYLHTVYAHEDRKRKCALPALLDGRTQGSPGEARLEASLQSHFWVFGAHYIDHRPQRALSLVSH